jgi:regulator of sigma E protease
VDLIAVGLLAALDFSKLGATALSWLWVAIGLGLVIFFHELGHFAVAKWCGVFVERFSIGFGPILWSFKKGDTEYALSAVPFGGYVKMLGQDDMDPSQLSSEEIAEDPKSYSAKPVWQRMAIISAGVIMNIITGLIFFAIAFKSGVQTRPARLGPIVVGKPAWKAGLQTGDLVTRINGRECSDFGDIMRGVALTSGDVEIEGIYRDGRTFKKTLTPDKSDTRRMIGVAPGWDLRLTSLGAENGPCTVAGTPAADAGGFLAKDRIVEVGGEPVKTFAELQNVLTDRRGEELEFIVERGADDKKERVAIKVAPNRFRRLGLSMDIEKISAIETDSPADRVQLKPGDKIAKVDGKEVGKEIDPVELPDYFQSRHGQSVAIEYTREVDGTKKTLSADLIPVNRTGWTDRFELKGSPLSVPSIGVAYHITSRVLEVQPGSPADGKIAADESITAIELFLPPNVKDDGFGAAFGSLKFEATEKQPYIWAQAFWLMQMAPTRHMRLTVASNDKTRVVELEPARDPNSSLYFPDRGFVFDDESMIQKAATVGAAFEMAADHARSTGIEIYLTLRSLVRRDLSFKELHGPIGIAKVAHQFASQGLSPLLLFLGFLSVNLAVLNFLPIPVLDGGHMVFLCWEAVTRKRPSERVLIGATYCGMAFVLGLMVLVIYLDLFVHTGGPK